MHNTNQTKAHSLRNLIIFAISIVAIPWLGWALDVGRGADPHDQQNSLGWLFFLVAPLLTVILLRSFGGDGWQDAGLRPLFKGNRRWYAFALLFHPISMSLILLAGTLLGATKLGGLSTGQPRLLWGAIVGMSLLSFLKNIFEEFAWRGYLAPKMQNLVSHPLVGHGLVGLIWFSWHLPYYLVLMSPAELSRSTALGLGSLLLMTFLGILPTAFLYGELRFRTDSVWPVVLIHTSANVFFDALVLQKIFSLPNAGVEVLISPAMFSLAGILVTTLAAVWLYRTRLQKEAVHA